VTGPAEQRKQVYEIPNGAILGKYEILRKIATGGMAEIYLARARGTAGFEKLVVLKRILPNVAEDPTFVQMFLDEARLAATLQHPNIADVYDVGEVEGAYFFTMEFIHGQDTRAIRHMVRERADKVPLAVALAIVHGTASALDYAHERTGSDGKKLGLVHRDVSSSNVLVSYDGAVKLVDFGIARASVSQHKTQTGTLKGKIPYMSPEQCKGLGLDRRSDLFSLGVLLYELTVGRRPFRGDSEFAIMDQIVYQGTQRPSAVVPGYPEELDAIVMKLLERAPSARFQSADEVIHALEEFLTKHHLWLSPKQLSKWMRIQFADRITAMEEAERQGVPFVQHVAKTITSQSQRSDLVTPGSAFSALKARPSQEYMMEAEPAPPERASSQVPIPNIPTGVTLLPAPTPAVMPNLRSGSNKGVIIALVAGLGIGGGGIGAYMFMSSSEAVSAPPEKKDDVHKMDVSTPLPTPTPTPTPTPKSSPSPTPTPTPSPSPTPTPSPSPTPTPVRTVKSGAHPVAPTPIKKQTPKAKPDTKPDPKPDPKPDTKQPSWDPNSPLLPQ
jgi:serine/threonine-protein kinase